MTQRSFLKNHLPDTPLPLINVQSHPPELQNRDTYVATLEEITASYKTTERLFARTLHTFQWWYYSRIAIHWLLFMLGIGALIAAMVSAVTHGSLGMVALLAGIGFVAFVAFFTYKVTQTVEQTVMYMTWLNIIYNGYVSSLLWLVNSEDAIAALNRATEQAFQQLQALLAHHARTAKGQLSGH